MYLEEAKAFFETSGLAAPDEVRPCTEEEVLALERAIGRPLPAAYREFLLWMGQGAGIFLRGEFAFCKDLHDLRQGALELLAENSIVEPLPEDAFVFFMHDGYVFYFFHLSADDDPPVYIFHEARQDPPFRPMLRNFSQWLLNEMREYTSTIERLREYKRVRESLFEERRRYRERLRGQADN